VKKWLNHLTQGHSVFLTAFDQKCWGLSSDVLPGLERSIQAALDGDCSDDIVEQKEILEYGLRCFRQLFGYQSRSFIASNFIWSPQLNDTLWEEGVEFLQGMKYQKLPLNGDRKRKMIRHHLGEKNKQGQYYLIRNCTFEPSLHEENFDNVGNCLRDIEVSFFWGKPAIITSHRINFTGYLNPANRNRNLKQLQLLLKEITIRWPQTEFMTSVQLGELIKESSGKSGTTKKNLSTNETIFNTNWNSK
jgi:hypothetical protein